MIKRLTEPNDIAKLMKFSDNVEEVFPCSRGEWVQWLMGNCANDGLFVMAVIDDREEITGYLVARNQVLPPLSDCVYVKYAYLPGNIQENEPVKDELVKWAKNCKARRIILTAKDADALKPYGFEETGATGMEMIL